MLLKLSIFQNIFNQRTRILGKYFDKENMEFKDDDTFYDVSQTDDLKGNKIVINEDDDDFDDEIQKNQKEEE